MADRTRRTVLAAFGGTVTFGLAGCVGGDGDESEGSDDSPSDDRSDAMDEDEGGSDMMPSGTANVRVAHFSPDAPNVDVYVDGETVLSDVAFRAVSKYLEVPAGARTVKLTAAGDESTVAFEGDVTVEAETDYTVAAIGELEADTTEFRPLVLEDDNSEPGQDTARVRVVHASPDAPAVDVTTASGGTTLVDGAAFGESASAEDPSGAYTLEVRGDTDANDGDVVAEFDVEVAGNAVYTAFAGGYLAPEEKPVDAPFDLTIAEDASY